MKKISLVTLIICMMMALSACSDKTEEGIQDKEVTESVTDSAAEQETAEVEQSQEYEGIETDDEEQLSEVEKLQILSLQESRNARYEGVNDFEKLLLVNEFNNVTFWKGADKYPERTE